MNKQQPSDLQYSSSMPIPELEHPLLNHKNRLACYLLLEHQNKVLMLLRENTGFEDGNYSLISGKVEAGESLSESIIREAEEEAGIVLDKKDIMLAHVLHRKTTSQQSNWIDFFFRADKWDGEITNKEPEKCGGLHWFSTGQLPENIVGYIELVLKNIDQGIPYHELHW